MAYLLAGLLSIEKCLSAGHMFKLFVDISSTLNKNVSAITTNNTNEDINTIMEEYNLECMIKVVQSLTNEFNMYPDGKIVEIDDINKSQSDSYNKDNFYVVIQDKQNFLKSLSPDYVVIYYLCDSMIKINDLLIEINKKNAKYNNSYIALSKPDFKRESIKLKLWSKQLKERLELYKIVKK